jgi:hypothetical protein
MDHELPEIKVIPIKDLMLHETEDPKRTKRLEERIMSDGFLKNPVVVGRVRRDDSKFLLLDGVHRVSALRNLGFSDVVAQVVDYFDKDVKIDTWCHLIIDANAQDLLARIREIKNVGLAKTSRERAAQLLQRKKIVCCLLFKNKDVFAVRSKNDLRTRVSKLGEVVNVYCGSSTVKRGSEMETTFLLREHETAVAVMVIPVYAKKEIMRLAFDEIRLPPGVTRHIIPLRVLGFHVDLGLLKVDMSIEEKNRLVQQMFSYRVANGKTRFYRESVLIFDD